MAGEPVKGKAYVKSISDGRYTVVSPMGAGTKFDVGPAAWHGKMIGQGNRCRFLHFAKEIEDYMKPFGGQLFD